ncbi:MAG: [FeFe] hydrogenase H-cluster radical SAM maturase HydE [Ignavibacteriae bacterium HGW-Ignavibacteriae-3]|nr:MAG: [FeFe] hydrogenase H-cluster radical SAM maturase HydE [Ignavibacteriae bacterium HGW-Ignavibacteriae-3]
MILDELLNKDKLSKEEIIFLLNLNGRKDKEKFFARADELRLADCGDGIEIRGIVKFSNYCNQNCLYCSYREDNYKLARYRMSPDEIIHTAQTISNLGIGKIILQSGEDHFFDTDIIAYIIFQIKQLTKVNLTLSLGERRFDEYRTWKIAGADRYILKHKTANPNHYAEYHAGGKLADRISQLRFLKTIGYQIGSGNIVGLPLQTIEDIADDILLFDELKTDVITIGQFIPSLNTPYQKKTSGDPELLQKTIAAARLVMKNTHISISAEPDSLDEVYGGTGLYSGADVIMPDLTPPDQNENHRFFRRGKKIDEGTIEKTVRIQKSIAALGRKIV